MTLDNSGASTLASSSHIALMVRPFGAPRIHMDENAMTGTSSASVPFESTAPLPASAPAEFSTPSEAARYLATLPRKKAATETPAESAEPATAEHELSGEDNAAADENQLTGETEEIDPAEQPPLDLPRSWTKAQTEHWKALPRSTQEYLLEQASKDSAEVRRIQNETAEKLKGLTAKEQQAEQVRTQYEGKLKSVVDVLEKEQLRDFPDIRTQDDLAKLNLQAADLTRQAASLWQTDPFAAGQLQANAALIRERLTAWENHQRQLQAAHHELTAAESRKATETQNESRDRKNRETAMLIEKAPEFADAKKLEAAQVAAAKLFRDMGYSDEELVKLGSEPLLDDHRIQLIINDAMKYRAIKAAPPKVVPKTVPPVQRPGTSKPAGSGDSVNIQALIRKLNETGSEKDAFALLIAKRNAAARRATS